jgi:hypothetical protein
MCSLWGPEGTCNINGTIAFKIKNVISFFCVISLLNFNIICQCYQALSAVQVTTVQFTRLGDIAYVITTITGFNILKFYAKVQKSDKTNLRL